MIIVPPISLGDTSTFSRTSTANYYDINGYLSVTPSPLHTMRLEYDPRLSETNTNQSQVCPYYLIEGAATNVLTYPKDFSNVVWNKNNIYVIPNVEGQNAFARQFADKIVETTDNLGHNINYTRTGSNETTTWSVYAKAGERTKFGLRMSNFVNASIAVFFDLSSGTIISTEPENADYTGPKASIKRVRDNWYRCSLTVTKGNINTTNSPQIELINSSNSTVYAGDGISGIYIAYAQLETGTSVTSPVPDNTAFVSRSTTATYFDSSMVLQTAAINAARSSDYTYFNGVIVNKGMTLEGAATNLLIRSEQLGDSTWSKTLMTVTEDALLSLNNTITADLLQKSSGNAYINQSIVFSATTYTASVFVKAATVSGYFSIVFQPSYANRAGATYNLNTGTVVGYGIPGGSASNVVGARIENFGGGWYRCILTVTTAAGSGEIYYAPTENNGSFTDPFTGTTLANCYMWGAQLETGYVATSYISTTSSTVTRAADISTSTSATRAADVVGTTNAIVTTNVPENDYTLWSGATAYTIGQYVRYVDVNVHKIYVALTNNTNKNPTTNPTDWQDAGSTNAWKMFDQSVQSQTSVVGGFTTNILLNGTPINNVTLMNVYGKKVRATLVHKTDGVLFDQTVNLRGYAGVIDWYTYFYNKYYKDTSFMFTNIPTYGDATLNIMTYSNSGDSAKVGVCVLGTSIDVSSTELLGQHLGVEHGAKLGIQDYSVKEQDDFGNYTILERPYAKRSDYTVYMEPEDMNGVFNLLASRRAIPTVYVGSDLEKHRCTIDYGFYKDFSLEIAYPTYSICTIQIEGLT